MTDGKTRVKDLAIELGISNRELIQALRDLGVQARSQMTVIEDEELASLRARFRDHSQATEVVRKEIQPGAIIRRRRVHAEKTEAPEAAPEDSSEPETSLASEAPAVVAGPQAVESGQHEPEQIIAAEPGHEPEQAAVTEPSPGEVTDAQAVEAQAAEVVASPEVEAEAEEGETTAGTQPEEPSADGQEEAGTSVQAEAEAEAEGEISESEATEAAPGEGEAEGEGDAAQKKARKKRKKKKEIVPETPQVRVISRPVAPPTPPVTAVATPAASTPPSRTRSFTAQPSGAVPPATAARPPAGDTDAAGAKKKRKKDRRVVEFTPQVAVEDVDTRKVTLQVKRKKSVAVKDKTGGKVKVAKRRRDRDSYSFQAEAQAGVTQPLKAAKRKLRIEEAIRVSDMAHQMGVKAQALIKILFGLGIMATINQSLDMETATLVAAEFDYEVERVGFSEEEFLIPQEADAPETLKPRPPVVTIMGHVDHGKTSLLDAIRKTNVTEAEAGGITQHIGAYHVTGRRGDIVFLDTPGHEAFTAMRARGAQVTDIVVLVVAADDGVMDQTREAVNHARAAKVPILVAVNKIDKDGADPDRVKRELSDLGLLPEAWGGETIFAEVSAKKRIGIDELLEMILLQAEVLELKANPDKPARGRIVEAKLDKGRGPVATVLIQEGVLKQGDYFVCGLFNGRVRAMFNDQGKKVKEAGPTMPVEVQGFEGVPEAGDEFASLVDEKVARRIAESRQLKNREKTLAKESKVTLETFLSRRADKAVAQVLNLILKADVQGSLEAVTDALNKLSTDEVKVSMLHGGAGAITESDILLASASNAIIIGFNVRPTVKVKEVAERENVDIRFYDIIYRLVGDIKDALSGMLSPLTREVYLGQAEVRDIFSVPKVGTVAGCAVVDGKITRNAGVRLLRDSVVIYTGKAASLRRFKEDVKEVAKGYECGIGLENYNDIKVGDFIEAFEEVQEARSLE